MSYPIMMYLSLSERQSDTITTTTGVFESAIPFIGIYPTALLTQVCEDTLVFKNIYRITAYTGYALTFHQKGLDKLCGFIQ